jgi:hypothetical protein
MKEPTVATVKRLFALSRNRCAHPKCINPLVETSSGIVTGIICHIKARNPKGPRYDKAQNNEQRHHADNLILLCSRHSKIIDSDLTTYTVELLKELKEIHERNGSLDLPPGGGAFALKILDEYRAIYIHHTETLNIENAGTVNINEVKKRVKISAPEGSIAADLTRRNYAKHLIDRYNEYAAQQKDRQFSHVAIHAIIRKQYGAKWDLIRVEQFPSLCSFLHGRIDRTMRGKINKGSGHSNYSTFEEYLEKYSRR